MFGDCSKKTCIFITYSTGPTSGIARRDPPRHVDVIIQILIKIWLMQPYFVKNRGFDGLQRSYGLGNGLTSSGRVDLYRAYKG